MSTTIDQAFIKQFDGEINAAYQRQGTKLRGTVRLKTGVVGSSYRFQKHGKGIAGVKDRHGKVPVMNTDFSHVEATLSDYYAGEWSDKMDELKTNIDERTSLANACAWAIGRKVDDLIIAAARSGLGSGQKVAEGSAGLTKGKVVSAIEKLNAADVPDDGMRFGLVAAHQWEELLNIQEFAHSDFVGESFPWLAGTEAKRWRNIVWIMHSGLPVSSGTRYCLLYHKDAIGWAEHRDIESDISWHGDYAAHFINAMIGGGGVRIYDEGVVEIACDDDKAIT